MHRIFLIFLIMALAGCTREAVKKESTELTAVHVSDYPVAYVIKEQVNLRSSNNIQSDIVNQMNDGDVLYIIRNKDGWYEVRTDSETNGWIRSDLAGPKELCKTCLARIFADSIMPAFNGEIFIDKNELYKIIYLTFAKEYYQSTQKAQQQARKTGQVYQQKVYPGAVEVRVLKPGTKELITKIMLPAIGIGDPRIPVLKSGILVSFREKNNELFIKVHVPAATGKTKLLNIARSISRTYEYPISKVEIYFYDKANPYKCLFYYLEDKDGEYFKEECK